MTHFEKLVRDKIPEHLKTKGIPYTARVASPYEFKRALIQKLLEEAQEFCEAGAPEELADVLEVISALRHLPEYANVEELRLQKLSDRGGFDKKIILAGEK